MTAILVNIFQKLVTWCNHCGCIVEIQIRVIPYIGIALTKGAPLLLNPNLEPTMNNGSLSVKSRGRRATCHHKTGSPESHKL